MGSGSIGHSCVKATILARRHFSPFVVFGVSPRGLILIQINVWTRRPIWMKANAFFGVCATVIQVGRIGI